MITKVLKPEQHGAIVYDNKDSSMRLVKYMEHEAKVQNREAFFFNHITDGIASEVVVENVDSNMKGLRKEDAKFYSLVVSPSQNELTHIGSREDQLKAYTRQVMENYARNFNLKGDTHLNSADLVWYAIIHRERTYSGVDQEVKTGKARSGETKPGDQTHVHIIVSRGDRAQKISLTPNGSKDRFNIKDWQAQNAADFKRMFGYRQQTHYAHDAGKEMRLRERVISFIQREGIDRQYLNPDRLVSLAKAQQFDWKFFRNLKTLEKSLSQGLRPPDPYAGLNRESGMKSFKPQRDYLKENERDTPIRKGFRDTLPDGKGIMSKAEKEVNHAPSGSRGGVRAMDVASLFGKIARITGIARDDESWSQPKPNQKRNRRRLRQKQREHDSGLER